MKNTIGNNIQVSVFGESHGKAIGCVIDGLAAGIKLDLNYINQQLDLRKPKGKISTQRHEKDELNIVSGYFNGYTTGTPLTIIMENSNTKSKDYEKSKNLMRPSHADYTGYTKYGGYNDYRGGGHFSGRLTAPLVAAGAIAKQILKSKEIYIGSHILSIKELKDESFYDMSESQLRNSISQLEQAYFPVIQKDVGNAMLNEIEKAQIDGDSVGGIIQSCVMNIPAGIGEPMFDSIESILAHNLYSVPAVKGVEFGLGFNFNDFKGSEVNDSFYYDDKKIKTKSNNNGGINGGISNGMPIILQTVIKPTASIYKKQQTIDIEKQQNAELQIDGRHDPAIVHRARVVIDSMIALGILDLCVSRYGYLWMGDK